MREYIFTERERNIIQTYIEKGIRLEGFNQLDHRMKSSWSNLLEDIILALRLGATEYPLIEEYVRHVQRLKDYLAEFY